jgi:hypothetical protein
MEASDFMPLVLVLIPIIAISGGIIHGIVRTIGRQRLAELAQKERIAAIERGIDPAKLPPMLPTSFDLHESGLSFEQRQRRTWQGLMIGGIISTAVGLGLGMAFIWSNNVDGWVPGLVLFCIGIALLLSARLVRTNTNGGSRP